MGGRMTAAGATVGRSRNLVLAAMIFAVAMTFIDQTIVSIAAPHIQRELGLTSTGMQWAINAYLLSLAALFAFGGRLADTVGHRRMVVLGVIVFAGASAMCGLTPKGSVAEAWIVTFRVVQGAGGAIMFPAALAIVVQTFALRERGKALALFFGIAGGLTAIGPILGGFLTEWTWRAIFWVNIPVAIIALVLIAISKPRHRAPAGAHGLPGPGADRRRAWPSACSASSSRPSGAGAIPATGLCIAVGRGPPGRLRLRRAAHRSPLMQVSIFRIRAFLVENLVLGIAMLVVRPRVLLRQRVRPDRPGQDAPRRPGLYLLYFFIGFVVAAADRRADPRPAGAPSVPW